MKLICIFVEIDDRVESEAVAEHALRNAGFAFITAGVRDDGMTLEQLDEVLTKEASDVQVDLLYGAGVLKPACGSSKK